MNFSIKSHYSRTERPILLFYIPMPQHRVQFGANSRVYDIILREVYQPQLSILEDTGKQSKRNKKSGVMLTRTSINSHNRTNVLWGGLKYNRGKLW